MEDGCDQMELTLDGPDASTLAPGRPLWDAFESTLKELPGRVHHIGDEGGQCIRSKRGREGSPKFRTLNSVGSTVKSMAGNAKLNLNLSPEKLIISDAMRGRGSNIALNARGVGSRGRGRGSGLGVG